MLHAHLASQKTDAKLATIYRVVGPRIMKDFVSHVMSMISNLASIGLVVLTVRKQSVMIFVNRVPMINS
jgi:hypothetical protein